MARLELKSHDSQQEWLSLAEQLVAAGANIRAVDLKGRGICHKAAEAQNQPLLRWALKKLQLDLNYQDNHGRTPLLLAVKNGCLTSVQTLLASMDWADIRNESEYLIEAMKYAKLRDCAILRSTIKRPQRSIDILKQLMQTSKTAFKRINIERQNSLAHLRESVYIKTLC